MFIQEDSPVQPKPALLILDRDSSRSTETADRFNSSDPKHQEPSAEQETGKTHLGDGPCPFQNGTGVHGQSRDEEVQPDKPAVGDTGKASDKAKCAEWRAESDSDGVSAPSCGNQGEEADTELGVISAKQGADKGNREPEAYQSCLETDSSAQSGNLDSQDMGQSQDHSPLPTETSQSLQRDEGSVDVSWRGDLPEEKEGETNSSSQETASLALSSHDPEENGQPNDKFERSSENGEPTLTAIQVNSELISSVQNNESDVADPLDRPETGNLSEHTKGNTDSVFGSTADDVSIKQNSGFSISEVDSISLRPKMAPGPIHKGRPGPSPVPETLPLEGPSEEPSDHFHASSSETTSECPETLSNDLTSEIKVNAGDSDGITEETFLPEVTPEEGPQDLKEPIVSSLKSVTDDIAVSDLDKQSDEASRLPVDSEAFIATDIQQGVSTCLPSEPSDVIIGTTLRDKEEMKTDVELDSLSKEVEQILEEHSGDDTHTNEIHEPPVTDPELEEMKEHREELLEEKEMDSASQETISDLPDRLETAHVNDTQSKAQTQLPDISMEGVNTLSDLTVGVNDLVQGLLESARNQPSQSDGVMISDGCIDTANISSETAVAEDSTGSSTDAVSDVVVGLENGSTSDLPGPSSLTTELTSPLDINSELHQDLEHTSSVDTDNSLSTDPQPSDTVESESGLHQDNIECLMEQNVTAEPEEPHAMAGKAFVVALHLFAHFPML